MATKWGVDGVVKVGANTIAEMDEWQLDESVTPVSDTAMGDTSETHIPGSGIKKWEGSMTCHWDETDVTGQEALVVGASLTLNFYPEGATTGDKYWTGLASITSAGIAVKKDGDTIKKSVSFMGNGPLTYGTVV